VQEKQSIIGLDIGGTKTACVEGAFDATILQRIEMPTNAQHPFHVTFPEITARVQSLMVNANGAGRRIAAISVSIGGPLKITEGVLIDPPHLPGWHHIPLKQQLEQSFPGIPIYIEHDGNAGALAEFHFGVGKARPNLQHLIFLTFGTGIGAGFIVNGRILRGATDTAGEIGHWRLAEDGPLAFGKRGCWESFASGAGLIHLAAQMHPACWNANTPIRELVEAILQDDPQALEVAAQAGHWMGRGLSLLIDALNPQVIVFGSLGIILGERIFAPARKVIQEEALPQAIAACEIVPSALGNSIGDIAALMAALTEPGISQNRDHRRHKA
jgi:glucokinase